MTRIDPNDLKQDRALKLHDQGLTPRQIAERIGSNPRSVCCMIAAARLKRDNAKEQAGAG